MTEKYIKLDEALKLVEAHTARIQLQYLNVGMEVIRPEELRTALKQLPAIDVEKGGIRRKNDAFSSVEPPEDKVYILNDKGAVMMNFATFEMVLNGEITFSTIITRRKFEREEHCYKCKNYFVCEWNDSFSEGCPLNKPREPEKEESEE